MTKYHFSVAATQDSRKYDPRERTWATFVRGLGLEDPADHKDCGNIVGGLFQDNIRSRDNLLFRDLISIDADNVPDDFIDTYEMLVGSSYAAYTTWRHRQNGEGNRLRIWAPGSRKMSRSEYWMVTHAIMYVLGDGCDKGSAEPERLMHGPSTQDSSTYQSWTGDGDPVDVEYWLAAAQHMGIPEREAQRERGTVQGWTADDWDLLMGPPDEDVLEAARAVLSKAEREVATSAEGDRNNALMRWLPTLYRFVLGDCLDEFEVDLIMEGAAAEAGLDSSEYDFVSGGAWGYAEADGADRPDASLKIRGPEDVFTDLGEIPEEPPSANERPAVPSELWVTAAPNSPMDVARDLLKLPGRPTLLWWRGDWWQWTGPRYRLYDPEEVRRWLYLSLSKARYVAGNGATLAWNPAPSSISGVLDALKALLLVDENRDQPSWLGKHQGGRWLSHGGGIMQLDNRETVPHDHKFFTGFSVPFTYDATAPAPVGWMKFLNEVLPEDDQRLLLQQWFGYCLSGRVDLEKALLMVGPKRGGKGTIAMILSELLGAVNVSGPSITSLSSEFGLQPLIGKSLAVVGDARMGDSANRGATEKLLGIIGRDIQNVNRKNKSIWSGPLPIRFMIMTNEIPHFEDASGAIMSRFVMLVLKETFEGREDTGLKDRLKSELAGIFNWALDGLDMLGEGQKLLEPRGSEEARHDMSAMSSPITVWAEEACVLDGAAWTNTQDLYSSYKFWADSSGYPAKSVVHFARALRAAFPRLQQTRPGPQGSPRGYQGIRFSDDDS